MAKKRLCHQHPELTPWGPLKLEQSGRDNFIVTYGKQVQSGLTYDQAAKAYGQGLMHWLACEGRLDNRERGER